VTPVAESTGVAPSKNVVAYFSEEMQRSTVTGGTFTLVRKGTATPVSASVSYDAVGKRAILNPSRDLRLGATYVATVIGGSGGAKDPAGNPPAANEAWRFTIRR
jgi:hypothetical protein